ncbi:hypothetical protein K469DRAFT_100150 [Zopfia rhizophila CBS 207.26]|uniref:Uncharacterized protein n=1 Tax=Zopfia rhizophila CBS 207.26 TaxID=1314779 RepID=A0A6A6EA36_9PEZI|nr:hypothetical protein K469DRAFT_100150 [Zopfia rhizophila CBS 207.26]
MARALLDDKERYSVTEGGGSQAQVFANKKPTVSSSHRLGPCTFKLSSFPKKSIASIGSWMQSPPRDMRCSARSIQDRMDKRVKNLPHVEVYAARLSACLELAQLSRPQGASQQTRPQQSRWSISNPAFFPADEERQVEDKKAAVQHNISLCPQGITLAAAQRGLAMSAPDSQDTGMNSVPAYHSRLQNAAQGISATSRCANPGAGMLSSLTY